MDLQLKGRTAIVTGASQGLGRAIAKGLAAEGVKVAAVARRINLLEELAAEIVAAGGEKPALIEADLYPDDAADRIAESALKALGRVDILANAAGGSRPLPLGASKAEWMEGLTLNFFRLRELTEAGACCEGRGTRVVQGPLQSRRQGWRHRQLYTARQIAQRADRQALADAGSAA